MEVQKKKMMNAGGMGVESNVRKKSSRWEGSSSSMEMEMEGFIMDEETRKAMEVKIRRVSEEIEFFENKIFNTKREEQVLKKTRNAVLRKKSSRWEGSSSSMEMEGVIMDEEIRKAMEVEMRRLVEEEEFEKNTTKAMREEKIVVLINISILMRVERVMSSQSDKMMMGLEIRNAIQEEWSRYFSMRVKRPFVSMYEDIRNAMEEEITRREAQTNKYLMEMDPAEQIRNSRLNFVLHISPLEIIDNPGDQDFINVAADNVNQIELVLIVIDHLRIRQYWVPRSTTTTTTSSYLCQHHDDYLHPPDDDDQEMILATCRPLLDSPERIKIVLDRGVFAASDDDDDGQHSMSTLLRSMDMLFKYGVLPTHKHLEDLKASITRSISEAKPHVLRVKPKRVRICAQISHVLKKYYGSEDDATFAAVLDDALGSSS